MLLEQFSLHFNQVHELLSITLIPLSNLQKRYYLKQGSKQKKKCPVQLQGADHVDMQQGHHQHWGGVHKLLFNLLLGRGT